MSETTNTPPVPAMFTADGSEARGWPELIAALDQADDQDGTP